MEEKEPKNKLALEEKERKRMCKLSQMESDDPGINTDMCCVYFYNQKIAQEMTHVAAGYMKSVPKIVF